MALSIGFRIFSFLPSCYSSYGALSFYPDGTFTHCSCQPSLDAHFPGLIRPDSSNAVWIDRMPNTRMLWAMTKLSCTRPETKAARNLFPSEHESAGTPRRDG